MTLSKKWQRKIRLDIKKSRGKPKKKKRKSNPPDLLPFYWFYDNRVKDEACFVIEEYQV